MHDQEVLRLLRVDVHAARNDGERRPVGQVQVAVFVDVPHVAQRAPAAVVGYRSGFLRIVEVFERRAAFEEQLAGFTGR
jgi:hypothetical protein